MKLATALATTLVALALAACAVTPGAKPPSPPATPATPPASPSMLPSPSPTTSPSDVLLDGRDFLSVSVTEGGQPRPLVPNTQIRISFQGGQISASAGCNIMGGTYLVDDDVLIVDSAGMTEMGCDEPRHQQDDWLFTLLGDRPSFVLTGDNFVLTATETVITLRDREVVEPDLGLVGPTWVLTSIISGDAVSSVPDGVIASLTFTDDGSVDVQPGCNSGGGTYTVEGDRIGFGPIALTKMACAGAAGDVEADVLAVLSAGEVTFNIDAATLMLQVGDIGLQFVGN